MSRGPLFDGQHRELTAFDFQTFAKRAGDPVPAKSPPASDYLSGVLDRLEEIVDLETEALRSLDASTIGEFNGKKSQSLLELDRVRRSLRGQELPVEAKEKLRDLQVKLERNRWMLLLHLEAVREVASIITSAIQETESDGTYSRLRRQSPRQ